MKKAKAGQNKFTFSETLARKVLKGAERRKEREETVRGQPNFDFLKG